MSGRDYRSDYSSRDRDYSSRKSSSSSRPGYSSRSMSRPDPNYEQNREALLGRRDYDRPSGSSSSRYSSARGDDNRRRDYDSENGRDYRSRDSRPSYDSSSRGGSNGYGYSSSGYRDYGENPEFESYDDEERAYQETVQEIRRVKNDSLQSTRNAVRKLRETEEIAQSSLVKLGEQSAQLSRVESQLTTANYHATASESKTQELTRLNKNFILSSLTISNPFTKAKRREKALAKHLENEKSLLDSKESLTSQTSASERRINEAVNKYGKKSLNDSAYNSPSSISPSSSSSSSIDGRRYQGRQYYLPEEDNPEDNEMENEIDENLDILSGGVSRLKMMALSMQDELERHNDQIGRINYKTDDVGDVVKRTDYKVKKILKK